MSKSNNTEELKENTTDNNSVTYMASKGANDYEIHTLRVIKRGYDFSPCHGLSFITDDFKHLHLCYINLFDGCSEEGYNEFFDQIDKYQSIEKLYLETDFIGSVPSKVSQYVNLKQLEVSGSRFWNLKMTQVPTTVTKLILIHHTNLPSDCTEGSERLVNLEHLELDMHPFGLYHIFDGGEFENTCDNYDEIIPIADISKLNVIILETGMGFRSNELVNDWQNIVKNNNLFDNVRHRINSIEYEGMRLTVTLN